MHISKVQTNCLSKNRILLTNNHHVRPVQTDHHSTEASRWVEPQSNPINSEADSTPMTAVPPEISIITTARHLIESTSTWTQGKTYHGVKTYHRGKAPEDGAPWHCRVSEHKPAEATFDQLWSKLGKDKAVNEKE